MDIKAISGRFLLLICIISSGLTRDDKEKRSHQQQPDWVSHCWALADLRIEDPFCVFNTKQVPVPGQSVQPSVSPSMNGRTSGTSGPSIPGVTGAPISNPTFLPIVYTPTSSNSGVPSTNVAGPNSGNDENLGPQCLSCNAALAPTECDTVKRCGPHENCFMDVFVSDSGIIRYHLGCRDAQQCTSHNGKRELQLNPSLEINDINSNKESYSLYATGAIISKADVDRKRSQDLLVCTYCCTDKLCNSAGCGHSGYQYPRGPVCFNCPQQRTTSDCDKITVCGIDQVCMLAKSTSTVSHQEIFQTQCEEKMACSVKESVALIGRREVNAHCCKGDLCNFELFSTSATPVVRFTSPTLVTINSPCIFNPCARGTCSSYHDTYQCICEAGYFGRNCDQFLNDLSTSTSQSTLDLEACMSNPCVWGKCEPYKTTYICHCDHGYYGRNCDLYAGHITANIVVPTLKSPTRVTNPLIQSRMITTPGVCPPFPDNCPSAPGCAKFDDNLCLKCNCGADFTTTTFPCQAQQCLLDCGNPPRYKKDQLGCDICLCDFG